MFQQSEYEITNVEVHFKGLMANSGYHVHIVCVTIPMLRIAKAINFSN